MYEVLFMIDKKKGIGMRFVYIVSHINLKLMSFVYMIMSDNVIPRQWNVSVHT